MSFKITDKNIEYLIIYIDGLKRPLIISGLALLASMALRISYTAARAFIKIRNL